MVTVRFFAAAAEAAGTEQVLVNPGTLAGVREALVAAHGDELARVLRQCAFLVDGRRVEPDQVLDAGVLLDVLPPFAGG